MTCGSWPSQPACGNFIQKRKGTEMGETENVGAIAAKKELIKNTSIREGYGLVSLNVELTVQWPVGKGNYDEANALLAKMLTALGPVMEEAETSSEPAAE